MRLYATRRFPTSKVTFAVQFSTISTTAYQPLGVSLSVGEIKFPAALLITSQLSEAQYLVQRGLPPHVLHRRCVDRLRLL